MIKSAKHFFQPLALGAPPPLHTLPLRLERMVHFFAPYNAKMRAKAADLLGTVDVLLGNLEDAIPADSKDAARQGFIDFVRTHAKQAKKKSTGLWVRVNDLASPWVLQDIMDIVGEVGDYLDVIMVPKVEGPEDVAYVDRLLAQLEARHGISQPILVHVILETAQGVENITSIARSSPRLHGMSLGPADLAASRGMKTTRVGGGHPFYGVLADAEKSDATLSKPRNFVQQDPWHYTLCRMVDACMAQGLRAFYGPFGDIADSAACMAQFRNAFLLGCVGAWSLHPSQIAIAKKVFSPTVEEVQKAQRILEALPDGHGVAMVDGKMQDDATWKQASVIMALAKQISQRDPELAQGYGL